ncbi:MAG: restriction endonuclease [Tissierellia bacterium]|nr:restriction endonuclease [Tissierellia bacterium]
MINRNKNRKVYVEETIGSRNYFSFSADLFLYKLVICIVVYLIIFYITSELFISIVFSLQILLIFTLINKLIIERKENEGKQLLLLKFKKDYFFKKINEMDILEFEKFIKYYFEKQGYKNFKKAGKHLYLINKHDADCYVKIYKFHEGAEIEKTDVRNFISIINNSTIKNGIIVTTNNLSNDAKNNIEKLKLNLNIINIDKLYEFANKNKYLPEDNYFYKQIHDSKIRKDVKKYKVLKNNIFNTKKIIIYIASSIFFYIMSEFMPNNNLTIYISYYFIVLTIISALYFLLLKTIRTKVKE